MEAAGTEAAAARASAAEATGTEARRGLHRMGAAALFFVATVAGRQSLGYDAKKVRRI